MCHKFTNLINLPMEQAAALTPSPTFHRGHFTKTTPLHNDYCPYSAPNCFKYFSELALVAAFGDRDNDFLKLAMALALSPVNM